MDLSVTHWNEYQVLSLGDKLDMTVLDSLISDSLLCRSSYSANALQPDIVVLSEFCEVQGPKPTALLPHDADTTLDLNAFCLRIMSVDCSLRNSFSSLENFIEPDTQAVISCTDSSGVQFMALVNYTMLFDIQARGFVRPCCISYLTTDRSKVDELAVEIFEHLCAASDILRYGNVRQFVRDLEMRAKHLSKLQQHMDESGSRTVSFVINDKKGFSDVHYDHLVSLLADTLTIMKSCKEFLSARAVRIQSVISRCFDGELISATAGVPPPVSPYSSSSYELFASDINLHHIGLCTSTKLSKRLRDLTSIAQNQYWTAVEYLLRVLALFRASRAELMVFFEDYQETLGACFLTIGNSPVIDVYPQAFHRHADQSEEVDEVYHGSRTSDMFAHFSRFLYHRQSNYGTSHTIPTPVSLMSVDGRDTAHVVMDVMPSSQETFLSIERLYGSCDTDRGSVSESTADQKDGSFEAKDGLNVDNTQEQDAPSVTPGYHSGRDSLLSLQRNGFHPSQPDFYYTSHRISSPSVAIGDLAANGSTADDRVPSSDLPCSGHQLSGFYSMNLHCTDTCCLFDAISHRTIEPVFDVLLHSLLSLRPVVVRGVYSDRDSIGLLLQHLGKYVPSFAGSLGDPTLFTQKLQLPDLCGLRLGYFFCEGGRTLLPPKLATYITYYDAARDILVAPKYTGSLFSSLACIDASFPSGPAAVAHQNTAMLRLGMLVYLALHHLPGSSKLTAAFSVNEDDLEVITSLAGLAQQRLVSTHGGCSDDQVLVLKPQHNHIIQVDKLRRSRR